LGQCTCTSADGAFSSLSPFVSSFSFFSFFSSVSHKIRKENDLKVRFRFIFHRILTCEKDGVILYLLIPELQQKQ
jgi:hypothetical protein